MINYVFYTIVSLGASFLVYNSFLKTQKTFQFNRFFLFGSLLLSLLAPVMEIDVLYEVPSITEISIEPSDGALILDEVIQGETIVEIQKSSDSLLTTLWYIYLIVTFCFVLRFIKNLIGVLKLTNQDFKRIRTLKLVEVDDCKKRI